MKVASRGATRTQTGYFARLGQNIATHYELYLFMIPALVAVFVFLYIPMYGIQIAFRDYTLSRGVLGSPWVGLKHLERFLGGYHFLRLLRNTLVISIYGIIVGFPIPIVFALLLNQFQNQRFKRLLQTVTYMPHFISVVVLVGMVLVFFSPRTGLYAHLSTLLGREPQNLMGSNQWFSTIYVFSGIWQNTGWNSIIFLAALSAVDPQLYDAASMDGASRFQQTIYIDLPALVPTIMILLILTAGNILNVGFEKIFLMQNSMNQDVSEVFATFVYKQGISGGQFSYAAAAGLFNNVVNCILLIAVNYVARRSSDYSLW
jgi:putative aldouronate transport system permease protein